MNKKDALSVSENMVTTNGLFWPVPIINLTKEDITGVSVGDEIALLDPNVEGNPVLAIQRIETIEKISDEELSLMAKNIFGTNDSEHPGVKNFTSLGNTLISGSIKVLEL